MIQKSHIMALFFCLSRLKFGQIDDFAIFKFAIRDEMTSTNDDLGLMCAI